MHRILILIGIFLFIFLAIQGVKAKHPHIYSALISGSLTGEE